MATYLFVVHDLDKTSEPILASCEDLAIARQEAVRALTELASDKLPTDGDRRTYGSAFRTRGDARC